LTKQPNPLLLGIIFLFGILPQGASAEMAPVSVPAASVQQERLQIQLGTGYVRFGKTTGASSVNGVLLGLEADYALRRWFSLGASFMQSFDLGNGFADVFTRFAIRSNFALTGSLVKTHRQIALDSWPVVESTSGLLGGWRLELSAAEYLLHGATTIATAFGVGLGLGYQYFFPEEHMYVLGSVRAEMLSNLSSEFLPVFCQINFGFLF